MSDAPDIPAQQIDTIEGLRADKHFQAALIGGDKAATARWEDAHRRQTAGEPPAAAPAKSPVDALRSDPDFIKALHDPFNVGHAQAKAKWEAAHRGEAAKGEAPPANTLADRLEAVDAPPATPDGYEIPQQPFGTQPIPAEALQEWRELAHACELPPGDFSFLTQAAWSPPMKAEAAHAVLIGRHGAEGAQAIISKATAYVNGLAPDVRERAMAWALASGVGNNPAALERLAMLAERRASKKEK